MTPFNDFTYLVNHVLLGEEPTIEDFILLVGTVVAFVAFVLWCCFPIQPKDSINHRQLSCKNVHPMDATTQIQNATYTYTKSPPPITMRNDYILKNCSITNGVSGHFHNYSCSSANTIGNDGSSANASQTY